MNHFSFIFRWIIPCLHLLAIASSCSAQKQDFDAMVDELLEFTVDTLHAGPLSGQLDNYVLLDAREKEEYAVSHLPGAIWVGYSDFSAERVQDVPRDAKMLVYCSVGYRSEKVGEQLKALGFSSVHNLAGGIFDWKNHGLEVVDSTGTTEKVHPYNALWGRWLFEGVKAEE